MPDRVVPIGQARPRLSEIIENVRSAPVTITKDGVPVAVVLAPDDYASFVATMELLRNPEARLRLEEYERQVAEGTLEWVGQDDAVRQLLG